MPCKAIAFKLSHVDGRADAFRGGLTLAVVRGSGNVDCASCRVGTLVEIYTRQGWEHS